MDTRFRNLVQDAASDLAAVENHHAVLAVLGSKLLATIQLKDGTLGNAIKSSEQSDSEFPCYPFDKLISVLNQLPDMHSRNVGALIAFYELGRMTFELEATAQDVADRY